MYGVLSFLLMRSVFLHQQKRMPRFDTILAVLLFSAGTGVLIEILQPLLTAFRKFEWLDMVANATGALTGIFLFRWYLTKERMGIETVQKK